MIDLYLKATTKEDMETALVSAELAYQNQKHGLLPASGISLDVIGPITKWDISVEPPVATVYPEWHVNVRCNELTEDQEAALASYVIVPPVAPYRVWA